jgi:tRNA(Ile)-lysidine synthase
MVPGPALIERFSANLDALLAPSERLGVAVSGGPDSLALLLLAAAARPGGVEAATVDHALRPESRAEAEMVADVCERLGVPHAILALEWGDVPASNIQAKARAGRYHYLAGWALQKHLKAVATAHHADDQAETLLMRLARGSGVSGLAGVRSRGILAMCDDETVEVIRPVLCWRRSELAEIAVAAGVEPVDDPTNTDDRFDRTRVRKLFAENSWLDPSRFAAVAKYCADADEALGWAMAREFVGRTVFDEFPWTIDATDLPYELQRRFLADVIDTLTSETPPGPDLVRALDTLLGGGTTTLAGLKLEGGPQWRISWAPPRRP